MLTPVAYTLLALLASMLSASGMPAEKPGGELQEPEQIIYWFEPHLGETAARLSIQLAFPGSSRSETRLLLPDQWGGQDSLFRAIVNLRVKGGVLSAGTGPQEKRILHDPGAMLHVQYDLVQYWEGSMVGPGAAYRPILQPDYFHVIGHAGLIVPDWDADTRRSITMEWRNVPGSWNLCNSFGTNQQTQALHISLDELRHSVYVGGDFRVRRAALDGNEVVISLRGEWPFEDGEFFDLVEKIIRTEREFWNDHSIPYYLVTLIPTGTECCSYSGTSITNSFATFVSTDRGIDSELKHLLAHELLHHWIGQTIRLAETPEQPEGLHYWFSEGFTDYYTRRCLQEAGLITTEEMIESVNRRLYNYFSSPKRNSPNALIAEEYWTDRYVQRLPYQRGDLLAGRWDAEIRGRSGGAEALDDVVVALLAEAKDAKFRLSLSTLTPHLEKALGRPVADDIRRYVEDGETIQPDPGMLGEGFVLEEIEKAAFDLGFDFPASRDGGVIRGVRRDGPADRAGLGEGQRLVGWSIHFGDAGREVKFKIDAGSGKQEVRYIPAGELLTIPQFRIDDGDR